MFADRLTRHTINSSIREGMEVVKSAKVAKADLAEWFEGLQSKLRRMEDSLARAADVVEQCPMRESGLRYIEQQLDLALALCVDARVQLLSHEYFK